MSSIFTRNFHLCFCKIKCFPTSLSPPLTLDEDYEENSQYASPTITSTFYPCVSRPIIKSFSSMYDLSSPVSTSKSLISFPLSPSTDDFCSSISDSDSDSDSEAQQADFSSAFTSKRFFVSSPGRSNSILEAAPTTINIDPTPPESEMVVNGCVPVRRYSPDPYVDFRRSMEEMIEAKDDLDVRADSEFLHELLLCYLNLNAESNHKFITEAFTDLLISLMSSTADDDDVAAGIPSQRANRRASSSCSRRV